MTRQLLQTAEEPPEVLDVVQQRQWRIQQHRRLEETQPPPWACSVVNVDGHERRCEVARMADRWAAVAVVDGVVIEIIGRGIQPSGVELRRLATLKDLQRLATGTPTQTQTGTQTLIASLGNVAGAPIRDVRVS